MMKGGRDMEKPTIKKVEFLNYDEPERRMIKCHMSNGEIVCIQECCGAYEQFNAHPEEYRVTLPIARKFTPWLCGKSI